MKKGSILQEDIKNMNVYAPNNRASNYMRQKLIELQGDIDESTIIVGGFNTLSQKWTELVGRKSVGIQLTQHHHQSTR